MSDPIDSQAISAAPAFSSPSGYSATTLTVTSPDGKTLLKKEVLPSTYTGKGGTPGSFVPKSPDSKPIPTFSGAVPKIDGIRAGISPARHEAVLEQNRILAELVSLGIEYKEMSLESEKARKLNLSVSTIAFLESAEEKVAKRIEEIHQDPNEEKRNLLLGELQDFQEALDKAAHEASSLPPEKTDAEKKAELQQEILELSFDVDAVLREARALEHTISDAAIATKFTSDTLHIENAFAELKRAPEEKRKQEFDAAYAEYKKNLDDVQAFIIHYPTAAPTPAPTVAPAPSPAPSPASPSVTPTHAPTPLPHAADIYKTWNVQQLGDKDRTRSAIQVFEEYKKFLMEVEREKKLAEVITLIENKKEIADALDAGDRQFAFTLIERFKDTLKEKKAEWKKDKDARAQLDVHALAKETIRTNMKTGAFEAEKNNLEDLKSRGVSPEMLAFYNRHLARVEEAKKKLEDALARDITAFDADELTKLSGRFEKEIRDLADLTRKESGRLNAITAVGNSTSHIGVLRPVGSGSRGNQYFLKKNRYGALESVLVDVRKKELDADRLMRARNEDLEKTKGTLETEELFKNALKNNPTGFIALYTDKRTDPNTGETILTENEKMRTHPYRAIIRKVLDVEGVIVYEPTDIELTMNEDAKKAQEQQARNNTSIAKHKLSYSPAADPYAGKRRPHDPKTQKEKEAYPQWNQRSSPEEKVAQEALKPQMKLDAASTEWKGMVPEIRAQHEMAAVHEAPTNETLPKQAAPEESMENDEAKKNKLRRALEKVEALIGARKFSGLSPTWKHYILPIALAMGGAGIYVAKQPHTGEAAVSVEQAADKKTTWRSYFHDWKTGGERWKDFPDDISQLNQEKLVEKYASKFFSGSNNPNLAQTWFISYILGAQKDKDGKIINENVYRLLSPARKELSEFIKMLDGASWAASGGKAEGATLAEMIQDVKRKVAQKEH